MGGARLRVETSFEERYTAAVAPPVGYLSEENTWATHAIGIFSHPASQGARSYLVDPASSHMLVSKIKPCMSKYKHYTVKLRMAH